MAYPANVSYFLRRMSGFHTNTFKLMPLNSDSATSGKIIQVNLPVNALLNMKSFAMHFDAAATCSSPSAGVARLPNKIQSLIERVEVLMGGISVQSGFNGYNTACHIKDNLTLGDDKKGSSRLTLMHEEIPITRSYVDNQNLATATTRNEAYALNPSFIIDEWLGFLGELEPQIIDSGILPEISIRITLAPDSVCSVGTDTASAFGTTSGAATTSYSLSNIYFTIETLALQDGVYDSLLERKIAEDGYIEIPYKNYYSFFDTHSGSTRFACSSQSLDKIYATFRQNGYDTQAAPQLITGTVGYHTFPYGSGARYISNYFKFVDDGINDYQFTVNNTFIPQYKAKTLDAYHQVRVARDKMNASCKSDSISGLYNWQNFFWCAVARLNHPSSEEARYISGFDSRGTNAAMQFLTTKQSGHTANLQAFILCECTSTLRVGSGKSIEIVA